MMKTKILLPLLMIGFIMLPLGVYSQSQKKQVAIYVARGNGDQKMASYAKFFASELQLAVSRSARYNAVERTGKFLELLNKEQSYQRSGQVDENTIAKLGKQEGVHFVLSVDMTDFGNNNLYVVWKLIDVESAIVKDGDSEMKEIVNMVADLKFFSEALTKRITGGNPSGSSRYDDSSPTNTFAYSNYNSGVNIKSLPLVDRLPSWYFEQGLNQTVGISFNTPSETESKESEYEQAICLALFRAALQQPDTNVLKGEVTNRVARIDNMDNYIELSISANLRIPDYRILDQCHLKNGPVLVLIQYQYQNLDSSKVLKFWFNSRIKNDSIEEEVFFIQEGEYEKEYQCGGMYQQNEFRLYSMSSNVYKVFAIPLNLKQYNNVMRNQHCLLDEEGRFYLGLLYFDDLRQNLYRKLMYRNMQRYNK